jgi:PAS domain S-box-containing protein
LEVFAVRGAPPAFVNFVMREPLTMGPETSLGRLVRGEAVVHFTDSATEEHVRRTGSVTGTLQRLSGARSYLAVPLVKSDIPIGAFSIFRQEVRPFSDKQIALLQSFAAQAAIAMENARLLTETREALDQQTATAEVLGVINSSPGNLAPVFDAMLEKAMLLCGAAFGELHTYDGERFRTAALRGVPAAYAEVRVKIPPTSQPGTGGARLLETKRPVHTLDLMAEEAYRRGDPSRRAMVDLGGARTALGVPLLKDETVLGDILIYRQEVRPFSDKQIALLQNFAAQAVIAMENARLLTETREALERQTATAEILRVISSSPTDVQPTFDAIAAAATTLSGAASGIVCRFDGSLIHFVAHHGLTAAQIDAGHSVYPLAPGRGSVAARAILTRAVAHVADIAADPEYAHPSLAQAGQHTVLSVPMLRDGEPIGAINVARREVELFSDKQIDLLKTFAAQAVIAIENVRLFNELNDRTADLQESLEYQTATSDVLKVISGSTFDIQPVFETIVATAARLCDSDQSMITNREGDAFRVVATFPALPELDAALRGRLLPTSRGSLTGRAALEGRIVHVADIASDPEYTLSETVMLGQLRTLLTVPLLREGNVVGTIGLGRQRVQPFTDRQIELVRTFADQAVIAIENARLINETRESLEQQTATAEILQAINSSPGDLTPVFDAMLEKAMRLCEADSGHFLRYQEGNHTVAAGRGLQPDLAAYLSQPDQPSAGSPAALVAQGAPYIHIADLKDDDLYRSGVPRRRAMVDLGGVRTALTVPMRRDDMLLATFNLGRSEVRPFTDKQIALVQNFAAQAVIAMENARLITETREALDQQTATAEVLQVINSSPGDLAPVFDAILEKAHNLCGVTRGSLHRYDGQYFRAVATRGVPEPMAELLRQPRPAESERAFARLVAGDPFYQIADPAEEADGASVATAATGNRTLLFIPLRKDGGLLGAITAAREEVKLFSGKEIALLQNFAAQAVIAIENARLITETREALEQQTATAELLQVINSSPGDLAPVFDAMLDKATRLCDAGAGVLWTYDDERFNAIALHGVAAPVADFLRQPITAAPDSGLAAVVRGEGFAHAADLSSTEAYSSGDPLRRAMVDLDGARSALAVPLRKDGVLLGIFVLYRREVRPFFDKQIALLQNFAAQAVIAMENARLLDQIRQRQAELRVTFDNMADGVVMFDENLRLAAWNRNFQELLDLPDAVLTERPSYADYLRALAERGEFGADDIEAELSRRLENTEEEIRLERTRPDGRVIEVRRNAVPDGGFVLIYSDITERKRSETEIRAARDAAEATLRDLRAAQANLIQAEKMASLGQLTAGIAHEIKNPLNFVNNFADLSGELLKELKEAAAPGWAALDEGKRSEIDETIELLTGNLEKIGEHGRRADGIVKSMLEHSRGVTSERRVVDLNNLIEEALNLAYHGARAQDQTFNIRMDREFDRDLARIELVPQEMSRVFINLFGNGFYAATKRQQDSDGTEFQPTLTVATRDLGDAVEVKVRDNGTGIPPEIRDKLFQPFFTTKPTGEGTGLGLSISYDIVTQQHGGTITVESEPGAFTEFTVRLPRQ